MEKKKRVEDMKNMIDEQEELIAILTDYVHILRKKYCFQELDKNKLRKNGANASGARTEDIFPIHENSCFTELLS